MVRTGVSSRLPQFLDRSVQVGDLHLHYAEVDAAVRPMILLHGIGMDWRVWQAFSRRLARSFHLYLLDMRGHGQSDKPSHGYTLPDYAADIEDFIDVLGLRDVVMVGSSLGGMVAASVEAPADIVTHRVLIDPPLTGGPVRDPDQFRDILTFKHSSVDLLTDHLVSWNPLVGRHLLRLMADMWQRSADGVIEDMLAALDTYFDVSASLAYTDAPTLLVQADSAMGGVLRDEWAEAALRLLPHGERQHFPGAGHAVHAYAPDALARTIERFVGVPRLDNPRQNPVPRVADLDTRLQ